jgi:hypothetical protein
MYFWSRKKTSSITVTVKWCHISWTNTFSKSPQLNCYWPGRGCNYRGQGPYHRWFLDVGAEGNGWTAHPKAAGILLYTCTCNVMYTYMLGPFYYKLEIFIVCTIVCDTVYLPYNRKLSREKIFTNFTVWEPPAKVSNLGMPHPPIRLI